MSPFDVPVAPLDPIGAPDALAAAAGPVDAPPPPPDGRCPECGHANPADARFCNRCGSPLADPAGPVVASDPPPVVASDPSVVAPRPAARPSAASSEPTPTDRPPSAVGKQAFALVGGGLLLVLALYLVTLWSGSRDPSAPDPAAATRGAPDAAVGAAAAIPDGPAPPLPDSAQVAADRFASRGTAGGFYESGRYYLTAAFEATGTNPTASAQWARRAVAEFEQSLSLREDPDVRLALAEALRFDPASPPMRPIEEVRRVLAVAPDHPGGTYLMGELRLMRAQFQPEWADSARVSFQRVLELAAPGDPLRARAQEAIAALDAAPSP